MRPSGEQWTIRRGGHEVTVAEVGATLRSYTRDGEPVLAGFAEGEPCPHARGAVLVPWPNRVGDGRWTWAGTERRLDLTEPERRNALHGLVRWLPWRATTVEDERVVHAVRLHPQPGWDWVLDVEVERRLTDEGLVVTTTVTNRGDDEAPLAVGAHPYVTAGEERVDELTVTCPAASYVLVDPDRMLLAHDTLAASTLPVDGTAYDLREPTRLGDREIDTAMTGLAVDEDGRWRVRVAGPRRSVTVWADAADYPWVQLYTGHDLPEGYARTSGLAVEPLTAGPEALRTGEGLVRLAPGASWSGTWGITPA